MVVITLTVLTLGAIIVALISFYGGMEVGDHVWPWEVGGPDDPSEADPWEFPTIPIATGGLGLALIFGAILIFAKRGGGK